MKQIIRTVRQKVIETGTRAIEGGEREREEEREREREERVREKGEG